MKRFPDDNLRTLWPRIMKLHRMIGHDFLMTPIDFKFSRSKVKLTGTRSSKTVSEDDNLRTFWCRIMKFHRMIGHDLLMTPIDFEVSRSKVKLTGTRSSKMVSR